MRASELINIIYFLFLVVLACVRPLPAARRLKLIVLGVAASCFFWSMQLIGRVAGPLPSSILRDWLPAPLFLIAYWTAGLFFIGPNEKLQSALMRFDRKILGWLKREGIDAGVHSQFIAGCLELAYLLCYSLLPMGMAVLYAARMRQHADGFWTIVLTSVYLCYAALPFAQTLPPRMLRMGGDPLLPNTLLKRFNFRILHYGSIQANTFPSAHVATAFSVSLVLLQLLLPAGIVFMGISLCIGIAVVLGRYHYAADALMGAAVAIAVFLVSLVF